MNPPAAPREFATILRDAPRDAPPPPHHRPPNNLRGSEAGFGVVRCGLLRGRTPGRGFSGEPLGVVARAAGSGVSGRRCRAQCAVRGTVGAALHIRPGPARGRSAESCGNTSVFNAIEILPCAERPPLHMGARPLKTAVLGRTAESCGEIRIGPRGRRAPMCNTPATGREEPGHAHRARRRRRRGAPAPPSGSPIPPRPRPDPAGDRSTGSIPAPEPPPPVRRARRNPPIKIRQH